jgi:hypothetical protein
VSFVENHPIDKDRVIVYAAPEGDEVGVYTRGTARLANGEARVNLGPTFRHVTNPDIGLTVYVTPVGAWSDLFVASKGTEEIVVKSHGGDPNAAFDYIVYGLRIGFEETSIVQEKTTESYIPSMKDHRELYARKPELRSYNALERFKGMRAGTGEAETDFSKSEALKAAIHEYDPATDPPVCKLLGMEPCPEEMEQPAASAAERTSPQPQPAEPARETAPVSPRPAGAQSAGAGVGPGVGAGPAQTSALATATATAGRPRGFDASETEAPAGAFFVVSEPVEAGDLLVLDPVHAGQVRRASAPGDTSVIGIAAGPSQLAADGNSVVSPVGTFYGRVKADAQYGAIRPGDLLVTSATPGCAMKAPEVIAAGTVIGKALEPLETGTGVIRVLVMPR